VPPEWRDTQRYAEVLGEEAAEKVLILTKSSTARGKHNPMLDENKRNPPLRLRGGGGGEKIKPIFVLSTQPDATNDGWQRRCFDSYGAPRTYVHDHGSLSAAAADHPRNRREFVRQRTGIRNRRE
jgi:hypothetical protein